MNSQTAEHVYAWLWIAWIVVFFVIELSALITGHPERTLSEFVWRLEGLHGAWSFARFFIAVGCAWLTFHFTFGWFR